MRTQSLKKIVFKLNQILVGYYHYYGITDNMKSLSDFRYEVGEALFKWLNGKSQKKSYTWAQFNQMMREYPLAQPKIYVSIYG